MVLGCSGGGVCVVGVGESCVGVVFYGLCVFVMVMFMFVFSFVLMFVFMLLGWVEVFSIVLDVVYWLKWFRLLMIFIEVCLFSIFLILLGRLMFLM